MAAYHVTAVFYPEDATVAPAPDLRAALEALVPGVFTEWPSGHWCRHVSCGQEMLLFTATVRADDLSQLWTETLLYDDDTVTRKGFVLERAYLGDDWDDTDVASTYWYPRVLSLTREVVVE